MFCPKCGTENPEEGKFCRRCGTNLGNVSQALSGKAFDQPAPIIDHKGRPVSIERAIVKVFTGFAFIAVAIALMMTGNGRGWWFWLLIPAFMSIGAGLAQFLHLAASRRGRLSQIPPVSSQQIQSQKHSALPPDRTTYVEPEPRYQTGDIVPSSVTENTTRHLEIDPDGKTMALPKE